MSTPDQPVADRCGRCTQTRLCFKPDPKWGDTPDPLCSPCWSKYADARAAGTYVDFNDWFDNGTDDEIELQWAKP